MKTLDTIESVVKRGICTQCGSCVAVCPVDAIAIKNDPRKGLYVPHINQNLCTHCGLCIKICPGQFVDFPAMEQSIFTTPSKDRSLGFFINCYTGYSTDDKIRYHSSSGGIVSSMLIFALKNGLIDGALVTRMSKNNPLEPEPFIARTPEEIMSAARSKYCPVPANIALREIMKVEGRYAVVGLPCHIHGLRKIEAADIKLSRKIALRVGLFCGHSPNFLATEYFLLRHRIARNHVSGLDYRGEGWPGGITIRPRKGQPVFIPHFEAWKYLDVAFTPWRCLLCIDGANEFADISFGDAWLDEFSGENKGTSLVMTRTPLGEEILQKLISEGRVITATVSPQKAALSQQYFENKKIYPRLYRFCAGVLIKKLPVYNVGPDKMGINQFINASLNLIGYYLSSHRWLWALLTLYVETFIPALGKTKRWLKLA